MVLGILGLLLLVFMMRNNRRPNVHPFVRRTTTASFVPSEAHCTTRLITESSTCRPGSLIRDIANELGTSYTGFHGPDLW